jgi:hypothetical protein
MAHRRVQLFEAGRWPFRARAHPVPCVVIEKSAKDHFPTPSVITPRFPSAACAHTIPPRRGLPMCKKAKRALRALGLKNRPGRAMLSGMQNRVLKLLSKAAVFFVGASGGVIAFVGTIPPKQFIDNFRAWAEALGIPIGEPMLAPKTNFGLTGPNQIPIGVAEEAGFGLLNYFQIGGVLLLLIAFAYLWSGRGGEETTNA